jgi:hypothetical protein
MGRFDNPPPYKSEKVPVPEWDEKFGEVEIRELDGPGAQELINISRKDGSGVEGKDVEYYAKLLSLCIIIGGEVPPLEWLLKLPFSILKRLGNIALEVNGMSQQAVAEIEKN